jgi:hypothetical protein
VIGRMPGPLESYVYCHGQLIRWALRVNVSYRGCVHRSQHDDYVALGVGAQHDPRPPHAFGQDVVNECMKGFSRGHPVVDLAPRRSTRSGCALPEPLCLPSSLLRWQAKIDVVP